MWCEALPRLQCGYLLLCASSRGCREIPVPPGLPRDCRGISAGVPEAPPCPPPALLGVWRAVFHTFFFALFFSLRAAEQHFYSCLNRFFPKVPPAWLRGSAMPCGEAFGLSPSWPARGHLCPMQCVTRPCSDIYCVAFVHLHPMSLQTLSNLTGVGILKQRKGVTSQILVWQLSGRGTEAGGKNCMDPGDFCPHRCHSHQTDLVVGWVLLRSHA